MQPYTAEYRANFSDTDAAGIVHFSAFFFWMESAEHELQVSPLEHWPSPHLGRGGQSLGHELEVSPLWHLSSPHAAGALHTGPLQSLVHSLTHRLSHAVLQQ